MNTEPGEMPSKYNLDSVGAESEDSAARTERDEPDTSEEPLAAEASGPEASGTKASGEDVVEAERGSESEDAPINQVEIADQFAELQGRIDALTQERTSLYDQLLRRQAEFENYRKRIERERVETYQRARAEVLIEFLPVVDNLERALSSLEKSQGDAEALRHGVELIHRQFRDAMSKFGLEPVESVGKTFDPNVHEAVTTETSDEHEENTIIEEFQRGYKMGDKLLRPAKVKVASTPEK